MKCCCISAALLLVLVSLSCEASGDNFSRIGISVGGVHIVGLYFERHFGEKCARAQIGYMLNAVSLNFTAVRYFDTSKHRPYVGIGYMKHLKGRNLEGANLVCLPVGVDIDLSHKQYMGFELIPAVSFSAVKTGVSGKKGLYEYILPLPSVSYKYRL
ncbi:hypothetical protein ES707_14519 [subsurface metagenome]